MVENVSGIKSKLDIPFFWYKNMIIMKPRLFKYNENFTRKKKGNSQIKESDSFNISAQDIHRGYSLEPPRQGGSDEYPQSMFLAK